MGYIMRPCFQTKTMKMMMMMMMMMIMIMMKKRREGEGLRGGGKKQRKASNVWFLFSFST